MNIYISFLILILFPSHLLASNYSLEVQSESLLNVLSLINSNNGNGNACEKVPVSHCNNYKSLASQWAQDSTDDLKLIKQRNSQLHEVYNSCRNERFTRCYPDLLESLSLSQLNKIYRKVKQMAAFRFSGGGGGACHIRALSLSYYLAKSGFQAKIIRMPYSPALVAMDRNREGELLGTYDNYGSNHYMVSVNVKIDGEMKEYYLDPQYMEDPLLKSEYFLQTTGKKRCQRIEFGADIEDYSECYYSEVEQNYAVGGSPLPNLNKETSSAISCGWTRSFDLVDSGKLTPSSERRDRTIKNNLNSTPPSFQNRIVDESTSKELIRYYYRNLSNVLENRLQDVEEQIQQVDKDIRRKEKTKKTPRITETLRFDREFLNSLNRKKKALILGIERSSTVIGVVEKNLDQD